MDYTITARCQNGHSQEIHIEGLGREYAEVQAGLLDGSSPMYVHKPGPESVIGKCGICLAQIHCTVSETQAV